MWVERRNYKGVDYEILYCTAVGELNDTFTVEVVTDDFMYKNILNDEHYMDDDARMFDESIYGSIDIQSTMSNLIETQEGIEQLSNAVKAIDSYIKEVY